MSSVATPPSASHARRTSGRPWSSHSGNTSARGRSSGSSPIMAAIFGFRYSSSGGTTAGSPDTRTSATPSGSASAIMR